MSKPIPPTYKTTNWAEYKAALKRRGSLTIWFDSQMAWEAAPSGKRGRQQAYSDAAIQTCLTLKVVFGMALRQTTGFVGSLLKLAGLDWPVPDFSTLSRRQKDLAVNISCQKASEPLHLLIDSTGIKVEGDGEWHARKHDPSKWRQWRKLHIARCTAQSTRKRWKSGPLKSLAQVSATPPCFQNCCRKSRPMKTLPR